MKNILLTFGLIAGLLSPALLSSGAVGAVNVFEKGCSGTGNSAICKGQSEDGDTLVKNIIDLLFYAAGVVAVIAIIYGGIKFIVADGDASKIKGGRDTIMYAVIGLLVALMAYAIVGFVLDRF